MSEQHSKSFGDLERFRVANSAAFESLANDDYYFWDEYDPEDVCSSCGGHCVDNECQDDEEDSSGMNPEDYEQNGSDYDDLDYLDDDYDDPYPEYDYPDDGDFPPVDH